MKELKIDKEFSNIIPSPADDELKQLEKNLKKEGWRKNESIIIWRGFIVDGHNRYKLCRKLNINFKTHSKRFKNRTEALIWIIDNQSGRRNLPDFARVRLHLKKAEILRPISREKQKRKPISREKQKRKPKSVFQISEKQKPINITRSVAEKTGVSHDTVSKVRYIVKKADKKIIKKLDKGNKELSINKVYRDLKKAEKREKIRKSFKETPLPNKKKKYNIIYADPPWYFKHYSDKGKGRSPENYYKCMSLSDIESLPIKDLADDNCVLFIWTTFPFLEKCFRVIRAWGFTYKTVGFVWVKKNKKSDSWFWGMGYWTRSNAEVCLIATKGSITRQSSSVFQIIDTPIEGHSKKPDITRQRIIELVGALPRIELFARQKISGWDSWGDGVSV